MGVPGTKVLKHHARGRPDAIVVGAGPSGLMAAIELATRGHDVLVLEEHERVGVPVHCTGLLGLDAFEEFDLPRSTILSVASAARFFGPDGESVLVESDRIRAAVVERAAFDGLLAGRARAAGATIATGCTALQLLPEPDAIGVRFADGRAMHARAVVIACGAQYRLNRPLGLGVPRQFMQTAQVDAPFPAVEGVDVEFGAEVAPRGFAWMVPFTRDGVNCARLGLMSARAAPRHFRHYAAALAGRYGVDPAGLPPPRLKMLPLGPVRRTFADRVLAVGDAAGLVKPTTGGGIYYGLISGRIAGEVLGEALARDALAAADLAVYEGRWRARLGADIRTGLAFRAIATRFDDRAIAAAIRLARVDGIVPLIKQHGDFNWHRGAALALLKSPAFRRIVRDSLGFGLWALGRADHERRRDRP